MDMSYNCGVAYKERNTEMNTAKNILVILLWISIVISSLLGNYPNAILSMLIILFFKLSDIEDKLE